MCILFLCSPQSITVHPYFAFLIRCFTFRTLFPKYANTSFLLIALSFIVSLFLLYIRYAGHLTWQATSLYSHPLHGAFNINTHSLFSIVISTSPFSSVENLYTPNSFPSKFFILTLLFA